VTVTVTVTVTAAEAYVFNARFECGETFHSLSFFHPQYLIFHSHLSGVTNFPPQFGDHFDFYVTHTVHASIVYKQNTP